MSNTTEHFQCNECGETWVHTGSNKCPFCNSTDTQPVEDVQENE